MTAAIAKKPRHRKGQQPQRRPPWLASAVLCTALLLLLLFSVRPIRVHYYLSQGHKALAAAKPKEALAHFQAARAIDPNRAELGFWMARASRKIGDLEGVRKYLEESRRLGYSDEKRLHREWYLFLAQTGRISEAEPNLKEMLLTPGDDGGEICDAFSNGYCLNLRFSDALKLLNAWTIDFPGDFRPHLRRGQIYAGDERWPQAEAAFRDAIQRAPSELLVQRELAQTIYRNKKYEEATQLLEAVLTADPTDIKSMMILAQISYDQTRHKEGLGGPG